MIRRVLIANRGEIAIRIARACRELGIGSVGVYSVADRDAPHLRYVDEAVCLGPAPARQSYLNVPALMEAARNTGADAFHPGYGFLSEDPYIAEICEKSGLEFIGPRPDTMETLGDKIRVREVLAALGAPVLGGSRDAVSALDQAAAAASATGYPIVLKAAAGGGGRGITLVRGPDELREAFSTTRATARAVFGDDRVYVEKYVDACRHIEIQVIADAHGEVIHLGERDCSVQRFYQKLVEESPAPGLPAASRARAAEAAVRGAAVLGLRGAATFEFLAEPDGAVHFIEVNARLQVEHPVTEMVTGLDIVREQLLVAGGERLSVTQDEVAVRGAAIECRINAEDPAGRFRPAAGRLAEFRLPGGPWTRVDTGYEAGSVIPRFYDSLIAKVIVWAPDREQAIRRADRALGELRADGPGVATTTGFLRRVLREPAFRAGRHTTGLVAEMLSANDHNGAVHDH